MNSNLRYLLKTRTFLLLFLIPFALVIGIFSYLLYQDFKQIDARSVEMQTSSVPKIMRSQRSYINVEINVRAIPLSLDDGSSGLNVIM